MQKARINRRKPAVPLSLASILVACTLAAFAATGPAASSGERGAARATTSASSASAPAMVPSESSANKAGSALARKEGSLPNVVLVTHEGERVRFYDDLVRGKVVLINFMFTTCKRFCPLATANLVQVQATLGEHMGQDVFMYSITLDPATDTPGILKKYAKALGARPGWTFLTGKAKDIEVLRRKLGVYDLDPAIDADKTQHSGLVVYGNDAIGRWAAIPGLLKPERIATAVLRVM